MESNEYFTIAQTRDFLEISGGFLEKLTLHFLITLHRMKIVKKPGMYYHKRDVDFLHKQLAERHDELYDKLSKQKICKIAKVFKHQKVEAERRTFSNDEIARYIYNPHKLIQAIKQHDDLYHIIYQEQPESASQTMNLSLKEYIQLIKNIK